MPSQRICLWTVQRRRHPVPFWQPHVSLPGLLCCLPQGLLLWQLYNLSAMYTNDRPQTRRAIGHANYMIKILLHFFHRENQVLMQFHSALSVLSGGVHGIHQNIKCFLNIRLKCDEPCVFLVGAVVFLHVNVVIIICLKYCTFYCHVYSNFTLKKQQKKLVFYYFFVM